jgi:predicted DCC family thiol-disulfide oxidoreductase YuxK
VKRWTVLYDADCGVCKWLLAVLLRWDGAERLRPLALQRAEAAQLLADLDPMQRMASWHLIGPDGARHSAGAAIAPVLGLLPGGRPAAATFAALPGASERAYWWVARHRSTLSRLVPSSAKRRAGDCVRRRERDPV